MKALFRKSVVVFYWLVLPLALLSCAGWLIMAAMDPSSARSWMMAVGAAAFAGVVGWRLWLNSRSVGWGGPMPPPRRLLLVFLPLAAIALAGLILMFLGLGWLAYGFWLADVHTEDAAVAPLIGGALSLGVGAMLIVPLALRLRRRPSPRDAS